MSQYASLNDLELYGPETKVFTSISDAKKNAQLEMQSSVIDTYLSAQYTLPLVNPIDLAIVQACITLTVFALLSVRGFNPQNSSDQLVIDNYDKTIAYLKDIASGRVVISNKKDSPSNLLGKPGVFLPE